jgi:isopenicillin-N N-acyltransferase-like protein
VDLSPLARDYAFWIEKDVPAIAEEIAGLAAGAGIRYEQAVLLQMRRELIRHRGDAGDCTSFAYANEAGERLVGQTVDLTGNLSEFSLVLHVAPADSGRPRICLLTFLGLCGYLGVNSAGLAIGLNMITSEGWRPGVPPYLLIRHLLSCTSVAEALEEIGHIHRASSRYLVLADTKEMVGVEMTVTDQRVLRQPLLLHSNHFLHPDFQSEETKTGASLADSCRRLERMATLVEQGLDRQDILNNHDGFPDSICVHNNGDPRLIETVAAVVMRPMKRELSIAFGNPCRSTYRTYSA